MFNYTRVDGEQVFIVSKSNVLQTIKKGLSAGHQYKMTISQDRIVVEEVSRDDNDDLARLKALWGQQVANGSQKNDKDVNKIGSKDFKPIKIF